VKRILRLIEKYLDAEEPLGKSEAALMTWLTKKLTRHSTCPDTVVCGKLERDATNADAVTNPRVDLPNSLT